MTAPQDTVIPLEISIRFEDLPRLARLVVPAVTGTPLAYRLDGSFTVEAGALGSPRFGPRTLPTGQIRVR